LAASSTLHRAARRWLHRLRICQLRSSIRLQKAWRRHLCYRHQKQLEQERCADRCLAKSCVARHVLLAATRGDAALCIQRSWTGRLIRRTRVATRIQSMIRGAITRCRLEKEGILIVSGKCHDASKEIEMQCDVHYCLQECRQGRMKAEGWRLDATGVQGKASLKVSDEDAPLLVCALTGCSLKDAQGSRMQMALHLLQSVEVDFHGSEPTLSFRQSPPCDLAEQENGACLETCAAAAAPVESAPNAADSPLPWICTLCGFKNEVSPDVCVLCDAARSCTST